MHLHPTLPARAKQGPENQGLASSLVVSLFPPGTRSLASHRSLRDENYAVPRRSGKWEICKSANQRTRACSQSFSRLDGIILVSPASGGTPQAVTSARGPSSWSPTLWLLMIQFVCFTYFAHGNFDNIGPEGQSTGDDSLPRWCGGWRWR